MIGYKTKQKSIMMIGYNCSFFVLLMLLSLTFFDIIITEIVAFVPSTSLSSSSASLSLSLSARRRPKSKITTRSCCFIIPVHNRITATASTTTTTILYGVTGGEDATNKNSNNNDDDDDDDSTGDGNRQSSLENVENTRQRLENLLNIETENDIIESNDDGKSTTIKFSFS